MAHRHRGDLEVYNLLGVPPRGFESLWTEIQAQVDMFSDWLAVH